MRVLILKDRTQRLDDLLFGSANPLMNFWTAKYKKILYFMEKLCTVYTIPFQANSKPFILFELFCASLSGVSLYCG